ncbi:hypothetical protein E2C01_053068 [Portunus trituberculatus]|uniref:Uncharacterized protein n=1 Tax=Portunus trituberculatus TaxID=210409 RepID=A0A5B7GR06_PORTR|nr:hypothetical protein [Portunus trituberculatus]
MEPRNEADVKTKKTRGYCFLYTGELRSYNTGTDRHHHPPPLPPILTSVSCIAPSRSCCLAPHTRRTREPDLKGRGKERLGQTLRREGGVWRISTASTMALTHDHITFSPHLPPQPPTLHIIHHHDTPPHYKATLPVSESMWAVWRWLMTSGARSKGHVTCFHAMNSVTCFASCQNLSKLMWPLGSLRGKVGC